MDIVLLSGPQGSGKSSTSRALEIINQSKFGRYDKIYLRKFAEPLYDLHDLVLDEMENLSGMPRVTKDGKLLQLLGTDWGRTVFGANVWVNLLKRKLAALKIASIGQNVLVLIDDCRFENEFDAFPSALRVRLNAAENVRKTRAESWREDTLHPSEVGLDLYDLDGKFDLYLQTDISTSSPEHCATLIMAQLVKKTWIEKRTIPTPN